jgi:alkylation response protein AidB-like acyl-CoA dehydrogenase
LFLGEKPVDRPRDGVPGGVPLGRLLQPRLPRLARGQCIAAFALTEPDCGSDARSIETRAERRGDEFVITGTKKWVTFGQVADLFLVIASSENGAVALLMERDTPGLEIRPLQGLLGTRASLLAELRLSGCRVPARNLVGVPGFGITAVALSALELGRYSVAWGCAGILRACREASLSYATQRQQFGKYLSEHQLVRRMLTDMIVDSQAARALCIEAGRALDDAAPEATVAVLAAKYFASRAAVRAALNAVQIHGANGCSAEYPVARYLRDAKVMEIIEGSNEMHQIMISHDACQTLEIVP